MKKNNLIIHENKVVCYAEEQSTYTIPKNVKEISDYAFTHNKLLKRIFIPASVKKIGSYCFSDCPNLKKVIFESGDTIIGYRALFDDDNLTMILNEV